MNSAAYVIKHGDQFVVILNTVMIIDQWHYFPTLFDALLFAIQFDSVMLDAYCDAIAYRAYLETQE